MKPQEAIGIMKIALAEVEWEYPMEYVVAFEEAIEALEKQIPKKPRVTVASHNVESYWCANCDGYIANTYDDRIGTRGNNCKWCGQAISWEGEE